MDLQTLFTQRLSKHRHTNQYPTFIQKSIARVGFLTFVSLTDAVADEHTHKRTLLSSVSTGMEQEAMEPQPSVKGQYGARSELACQYQLMKGFDFFFQIL